MSALCPEVPRCLLRWRITLPSIQETTISHLREDSTPTEGISNQQSVSIWQKKHLLSNRCHALQPRAWTLPRWAWCKIKNDVGLIWLMNMNFYHLNENTERMFWSLSPECEIVVMEKLYKKMFLCKQTSSRIPKHMKVFYCVCSYTV